MSGIDRPVFIVGSGRSGTTVLYNLLSTHPQLCWFSNLSDRFPRLPCVPLAHHLLDVPGIGARMRRNIIASHRGFPNIRPVEAERIYHDHCGFIERRESTLADRDPHTEARFRAQINKHLRTTGRPRFLTKQTANNQRLALMMALFPDARVVHIVRDGRAVASSLYHVRWWRDIAIWWYGGKKAADWEAEGREPIELCARQWLHDTAACQAQATVLGDRYLEIRYEDLVSHVPATLQAILAHCDLAEDSAYLQSLPLRLDERNDAWKSRLNDRQQHCLREVLSPMLSELGYQ
jgi:hypothetical protein